MEGARMNTLQATDDQRIRQQWTALRASVASSATSRQVWDLEFSHVDRQRLGNTLDEALATYRNAVGMWMELHGCSPNRAVIEIASALDWIGPKTKSRLLIWIGEAAGVSDDT